MSAWWQTTNILGTPGLSAKFCQFIRDSRVCEHLDWKAGHGILAKSTEDDFAPVLAGTFDDEPADDDQDETGISIVASFSAHDILNDCTESNLTGKSQRIECLEERQGYDEDHDNDQPKVLRQQDRV